MAASEYQDLVFKALADASRRRILDIVKDAPGCNVSRIAACFEMSRIGVMKHLRILEEADLLVTRKEGRERRHWINVIPIQEIHDRWTSAYSALWAGALTGIKRELEREKGPDGP